MNKCCWLYAKERISTYEACFIGKTISELVEDFNQDVGAQGWAQERAYYHEALMNAFEQKGIGVSAVSDGEHISFARKVRFDEATRALVVEEE